MIGNFPIHLESCIKNISYTWQFTETFVHKETCLLSQIGRFAFLLRYTSTQLYRMLIEHLPLPSLSLLHNISSGTVDPVNCVQTLRNEVISPLMCVWCLMKRTYKNVKSVLLVIRWTITVEVNYTKDWFALW